MDERINQAKYAFDSKDFHLCIQTLHQVEMEADSYEVQAYLGAAYCSIGDLSSAETHFLQAIKLSPLSTKAYVNLGKLYTAMGREADAKKAFARACELGPVCTPASESAEEKAKLSQVGLQTTEKEVSTAPRWSLGMSESPRWIRRRSERQARLTMLTDDIEALNKAGLGSESYLGGFR